ncbi:hypothetical protein BKA70DRAFT_1149684 [Coprinopsis sp. MPI-PUGE-AT-0042]|nr:hypothetical protein BKA70DRAFT_1149684 [Coprinopsis sp. MPI-PUGE-AT-0042]
MPLFTSIYEDTSPYFLYNGEWAPGNSQDNALSDYSEASFTGTQQNGAFMTFQYYGSRVSIIGAKRGNHGRFQVNIDGINYPEGNGTAEPPVFKDTLFVESLTQGLHTVQLANKEDAWLDVDQISWTTSIGADGEELIINTVQDSHPSWKYQPADAWSTGFPDAGTFSGRSGHGTAQQQATAELTFTGDCIALFGGVGPTGAAAYSVQVDSLAAQRFSASQTYARSRQLLYWAGGLGNGNHTIRIRMDSPVANQMLTLDYAEVYTTPSLGGSWEGGPSVAAPSASGSGSESSGSSTGLIAGIAVASALAGLALLSLLALVLLQRRRKRQHTEPSSVVSQPQYGQPIQPFITGRDTSTSYSEGRPPFMGSSTGISTSSGIPPSVTQQSMGQVHQSQYPVGLAGAVNEGQGQPHSEGDVASSSGTAQSGQAHLGSNQKAAEASRHRNRASEAPPAYNPGV